ncbi:MAG: HNH endonuclease [Thermoplasmatales archaeon]|nr:HNH endonuclease [Thermoplasmatales archaeon]
MNIFDKCLIDHRHSCAICRKSSDIRIHHIVFKSEGGKDEEENLIVLCGKHHDLAHLKGGLGKRLTKNQLREYRKRRIDECKSKPLPGYKTIKIYIPKFYNDGKEIEKDIIRDFTRKLLSFFGAYQMIPVSTFSYYDQDNTTYMDFCDEIQIIVSADKFENGKKFIKKNANHLKKLIEVQTLLIKYEDLNIEFL